jgi:Asp-tRNA(Asn)/Glu-tRNA(Gln) amidotransferase A subunit family amidase
VAKPLNELSAVELVGRIANKEISVRAVADAHLERIAARDDDVGAFIHIKPDQVRAAADAADANGPGFPLHGMPVAVKDIIETSDLQTGYGSEIYLDHQPEADADVVTATRSAGGLILGKTVSTEFAWRRPGKTRNPHNPAHTPGGSSSGSAAAVADFMAPLAFGTQTAGSVIRPAAYCGVVGFKPTYGTHPRKGVKELSGYLDTVGTFARSVVDITFFDAALRGASPARLDVFDGGAPRIGVFVPFADKAERDGTSVVEYMRKLAETAGAHVIDISGWTSFDEMDPIHAKIMTAEAAKALTYEYENHFDQLSPFYQQALTEGRAIPEDEYIAALAASDAFRNEAAAQLDGLDAILTLPAPGEAPEGLAFTGEPMFNRIWTMLRWPCVTIPVGRGTGGLPVGVQIVAGYGRDDRALAVAHWLEKLIEGVSQSRNTGKGH